MSRKKLRRPGWLLVVQLFAAALPTGGLHAHDMYYQEVAYEGRLYVFNQAHEYDRWVTTRRLATPITRPDYGPKGETVVFDSEGAIALYNFKHGKPGERPAAKPTSAVSRRDAQTTIETEQALINISNRVQIRWTEQWPDAATQLPGTSGPGQSLGSFRVRRAKFKLDGWMFRRDLNYELQLNWPALGGPTPGSALEDAYVDWDVSKRQAFRIRAGLFRVPFGRQQMTSSGTLQFVERSIVSSEFGGSRDTGAQLWGELAQGAIEWRAAVFNGNGPGFVGNDNGKYQYNARLTWQPNGRVGYSEADFESTDRPLFGLGVGLEQNDFSGTTNPTRKLAVLAADLSFKYRGFSLFAEYFDRRADPTIGARIKSNGYHAQAGLLLGGGRRWEIAFRYATWDPSRSLGGDDHSEMGAALNYYYDRHHLKVQTDFRRLEGPSAVKANELRIQTQFMF